MKQLIGSSNLFVMQVEMDVYTALKKVLIKNWKQLRFNDKGMVTNVRKVKGNMPHVKKSLCLGIQYHDE